MNGIVNSEIGLEILWIIFVFIMLIFLVMSWIFKFHWDKFGIEGYAKTFATTSFWIVSIILLLVMFISLTSFSLGL